MHYFRDKRQEKNTDTHRFDYWRVDFYGDRDYPIPGLEAKHVFAQIFRFFGLRKVVVKHCLLISKSTRSNIISEKGLKGFLLEKHEHHQSAIFDLRMQIQLNDDEIECFKKANLKEIDSALKMLQKIRIWMISIKASFETPSALCKSHSSITQAPPHSLKVIKFRYRQITSRDGSLRHQW